MLTKEDIYSCMNGPVNYVEHDTIHPQLFFGGGDIFGSDCLPRFDGLCCFMHAGPFHDLAICSIKDGSLHVPNVLYGLNGGPCYASSKPHLAKMIYEALDSLTEQGCRNIAFHGGLLEGYSYAEGARLCARFIVNWLESNDDKVSRITMVDLGDEYFARFGHLLPWERGTIRRMKIATTPFERYFESSFLPYMGKMHVCADRNEFIEAINEEDRMNLSVALFYINLLPQAVAKVCDNEDAGWLFCKCAGWHVISCGLGGQMHSSVVLGDIGLTPSYEDVPQFERHLREETEYFRKLAADVIGGDIWRPVSTASRKLSSLAVRKMAEIQDEIRSLVNEYCECISKGEVAPTHFVIFH